MTTGASHTRVLAEQRVSGLCVIERLLRRLPRDERELPAIMLGMAARTILRRRLFIYHCGVKPARLGETRGDFLMAIETLQCATLGAELVAIRALRGAIQILVCARKRPRRDLSVERQGDEEKQRQC